MFDNEQTVQHALTCLSVVTKQNGTSLRNFVEHEISLESNNSSRVPITGIYMSSSCVNQVRKSEVTNTSTYKYHSISTKIVPHSYGAIINTLIFKGLKSKGKEGKRGRKMLRQGGKVKRGEHIFIN